MSSGAQVDWFSQNAPQQAGASSDWFASNAPKDSRTWLDSVKDFAGSLWQQVNPVSGFKGAAQLAAHPLATYAADTENRKEIAQAAEEDFKAGNYAGGVAHALYSIIPFLGPQMDVAGNQARAGEYAKSLGASTGMGLAMFGPSAIKDIALPQSAADAMQARAQRLYQSALKPSTTLKPSVLSSAIEGGLENAVPVSKGGLEKVGDLIDDVNTKIAGEIAQAPNRPISKYAVASRLGETAQKFATQVNPEADLEAISKSGQEFLASQPANIPAEQAQALKVGTYQQLKGRYGQLGPATIEAQKALARGLKEELSIAFPELGSLNAEDSRLINLDKVLQRAVNRINNHQIMGIGTPIVGGAAKAVTGSTGLAAAAAFMKAVFDDPWVKSRVAIALNRAGSNLSIPMAGAKYAGYVSALGNLANSAIPGDQGNE